MIISLEGNIGAGKTTVLSELQHSRRHDGLIDYFTFEPTALYTRFKLKGNLAVFNKSKVHNPLVNLYEKTETDAAIAQLHLMKTSYNYFFPHFDKNSVRGCLGGPFYGGTCVRLHERSYPTTRCFIELYNRKGYFSPFVHDFLLNEFVPDKCIPDVMIYLDVDPAVCLDRIKERNRQGEEGITLQTLKMFADIMTDPKYLPTTNIIKVSVDAGDKIPTVTAKVGKVIKEIKEQYFDLEGKNAMQLVWRGDCH